jgi:hypothetical protein
MTNHEYYDRGYADGLANQPYDRQLSGYNYYHGFKAGQHVRRKRTVAVRKGPARKRSWARWVKRGVLVLVVYIVRHVILH